MTEHELDLYAKWDTELMQYERQELIELERDNKTRAVMFRRLADQCHRHMMELANDR